MSGPRKKAFGLAKNKFVEGINEQLDRAASTQRVEIRTIPVESVSFAPGNPRKLAISPEDIRKNLPDLKLPPAAFEDSTNNDWREGYETLVQSVFGAGKPKDDFMSIATFAASMRSSDRMLHPIVVWREETRFFKITGERRFLAHVLLDEPNIRATVWEERPNNFELSVIQWDENNQRENFVLSESLEALEHVIEGWKASSGEDKISLPQFMNIAGLSRSQANRYLKIITNGTPALRDAITERRVDSLSTAYELAAADPARADVHLDKLLSGSPMTHKEIQRERAKKGKRTRRRPSDRFPNVINPLFVRRMRDADAAAMGKMVSILQGAFKGSALDEQIKDLSMDRPKDVSLAFQKIYDHIKDLSSRAKEGGS